MSSLGLRKPCTGKGFTRVSRTRHTLGPGRFSCRAYARPLPHLSPFFFSLFFPPSLQTSLPPPLSPYAPFSAAGSTSSIARHRRPAEPVSVHSQMTGLRYGPWTVTAFCAHMFRFHPQPQPRDWVQIGYCLPDLVRLSGNQMGQRSSWALCIGGTCWQATRLPPLPPRFSGDSHLSYFDSSESSPPSPPNLLWR